jgi:hypothetical protein
MVKMSSIQVVLGLTISLNLKVKQLDVKIAFLHGDLDKEIYNTTKRLMSSPKCRSVEVINNSARPGSNHREVNYINNNNNNNNKLKRALRCDIDVRIK